MQTTSSGVGAPPPPVDHGDGVPGPPGGEGPQSSPRRIGRRALLAGGLLVVAGGAVVGVRELTGGSPSPSPAPTSIPSASASPSSSAPATAAWTSGASGEGAANGAFGAWRGRELGIAGTWVDDNDSMVALAQLQQGGEFSQWQAPLDIAVGAFDKSQSWDDAAQGAYEDRWAQCLGGLASAWKTREAPLYIRFAHEMNGNWYAWAVRTGEGDAFTAAWQRFRDLQKDIFPEAKLVFCVNRETSGGNDDWRSYFPGSDAVDVFGVDYYNQYPYVATEHDWNASMTLKDTTGAPKGLDGLRAFARKAGLPMALPEWSGNAEMGDSPLFIAKVHEFLAAHAGTGAGELLYDVVFNADNDDRTFQLFTPDSGDERMPRSSAEYQRLF